ncbi:MAG: hypothetical protein IIA67_12635 [Planctomycetes bacterium]|nr:hypothetical protein [Planctomycetota bacterium]
MTPNDAIKHTIDMADEILTTYLSDMSDKDFWRGITNNARDATGARLVVLSWFNAETQTARFAEWSDISSGPVRLALDAAAKVIPGFSPFDVTVDLNVTPYTKPAHENGAPIVAGFEEISRGVVDDRIIQLAMTVGGLKHVYLCPLKSSGRVIGSLSFIATEKQSATTRRICDAFSKQVSLMVENSRLLEREQGQRHRQAVAVQADDGQRAAAAQRRDKMRTAPPAGLWGLSASRRAPRGHVSGSSCRIAGPTNWR